MKTQRFSFIALMLIATFTFSLNGMNEKETGDMIVKLEKSNTHTIEIRLANLQQKHTKITVADFSEKIWLKEKVLNENGYAKKLNLAGMPAGEYILFIENRGQKFVQTFSKNDYDIAFFQNPTQRKERGPVAVLTSTHSGGKRGALISRISTPDVNSIGIQLANLAFQPTSIQLNLMYATPTFKEKVSGQNGYSKKLNLTGMDHGDYYLVIRVGEITQIQFFSFDKNGVQLKDSQQLNKATSKTRFAVK